MIMAAGPAGTPAPDGPGWAGGADAGGATAGGGDASGGDAGNQRGGSLRGDDAGEPGEVGRPLYLRLLGVRHLAPRGWQRALLAEGSVVLALLIALADLASAWVLVVLPLTVATVVVYHDLLEGALRRRRPR